MVGITTTGFGLVFIALSSRSRLPDFFVFIRMFYGSLERNIFTVVDVGYLRNWKGYRCSSYVEPCWLLLFCPEKYRNSGWVTLWLKCYAAMSFLGSSGFSSVLSNFCSK